MREAEKEKERERKRKGLPTLKKNHLAGLLITIIIHFTCLTVHLIFINFYISKYSYSLSEI